MNPEWAPAFLLGLLAAAALGLYGLFRRRARRHVPRVAHQGAVGAMKQHDFTSAVARAFVRQGFQIVDATRSTEVDLVIRRDRETLLVLCRHWQSAKVGAEALQRLQSVIAARGADGGVALTQGRFARAAVAYANTSRIRLIEGHALAGLLDGLEPTERSRQGKR